MTRPAARPIVGDISSVDEAMVLDVSSLSMQLKALLESHAAALESKLSGIVSDSEARLRAQATADLGALRESFEWLRPAAKLVQRFPGIAPCLDDRQEARLSSEEHPGAAMVSPCSRSEVDVELEKGPAKLAVAAGGLPARAGEEDAGRETRRIVEECVEKLWEVQARSLERVRGTWTQSLQHVLSKADLVDSPRSVSGAPEPALEPSPPSDDEDPVDSSPRAISGASEPALEPPPPSDDEGFAPIKSDEGGVAAKALLRARSADLAKPPKDRSGRTSKMASAKDLEALLSMRQQSETMKNSHDDIGGRRRRAATVQTFVEKVSSILEFVSTCVLVANVVWMAVATELSMQYVKKGEVAPGYFFWVELSFVIAMCVEVVTKLLLFRVDFFFGPGHRWNIFDSVIIILAAVDLALSAANLSFIRVLRGLRAIRATRVIRTAHLVPELRLMFASVVASAASLFWAFVLILLVLLLCAMGVQQTVYSTLETSGMATQHPELMTYYGSLPTTVLSLFMAISGGANWGELAGPLVHISPLYMFAYVLFIILTVFGLLNILTAVFVEKTANISHIDPALVIEEKLAEEKSSISQLLQILGEADTDGTGTISKDEFEVKLEDPRFRAQMQLLDLHILEVQGIFRLLDTEQVGEIGIEELVYGLMLMKGNARSMDMHTILFDTTRLLNRLMAFQHSAEASFKDIRAVLAAQRSNPFGI